MSSTFTKFDMAMICGINEATYLTKILWQHCASRQVQKRHEGKLKFMSVFNLEDAINSCKEYSNYADKQIHARLYEVLTLLKDNINGTSIKV